MWWKPPSSSAATVQSGVSESEARGTQGPEELADSFLQVCEKSNASNVKYKSYSLAAE